MQIDARPVDVEPTLSLEWHLSRAEAASDPYAFQPGSHVYVRHLEGGDISEAPLDWDESVRDGLLGQGRCGPDEETSAQLRDALHRFVVALGADSDLQALLDESRAGRSCRLVLRFAAAELYALPWESLPVGAGGEHLALLPGVSLQYAWPAVQVRLSDPSPRPAGGRILLAWSAAGGPVPYGEHIEAISAASGESRHAFQAAPVEAGGDVLGSATRQSLANTLDEAKRAGRPFAVVHLLAHGCLLDGSGAAGVVLDRSAEDLLGGGDLLGPEELRLILAPHVQQVRLLLLFVCNAGDGGLPGSYLGSLAQAAHREGLRAVLAPREPMTLACSTRIARVLYHELLQERSPLELALRRARRAVLESIGARGALAIQLYAAPDRAPDIRIFVIPPYRGLMSYKPHHAALFFGREAERDELLRETLALIESQSPTVMFVVGASGAGKSSLVMAGLLPALAGLPGARWSSSSFKPGEAPLEQLEAAAAARTGDAGPHLVVVDQFEEIFTHLDTNIEREQFVRRLWALAETSSRDLHFVLVIRIDYLGRCGEIALEDGRRLDRVAYLREHHVLVPEMDSTNLRRVIEEPARCVGLTLVPGLAATVLSELGTAPGGLPVLAFTLEQTWLARRGSQLTLDGYRATGGVGGALTGLAEQLWEQVSDGGRDPDLPAARMFRRILVGLIGIRWEAPLDTRRRVLLEELLPVAADAEATLAFGQVLTQLERQRLIVIGTETATGSTVEIAHEALIRHWSRLREWFDLDRIRLDQLACLRRAVVDWEQFGDHRLLRDDELRQAQRVAERWADDVTERQRALLARSLSAEESRHNAWTRELRLARDGERLRNAIEHMRDPSLAAALLAEVEAPDELRGWRQAVAEVLRQPIAIDGWDLPGGQVTDGVLHADGARVAVGTRGGALWIWSAGGGPVRLVETGPSALLVRFVQGGTSLLLLDRSGSIRRWTLATLDRGPTHWTPGVEVSSAAIDPAGTWLLLGDSSGSLSLYDLQAGTLRWDLPGSGSGVRRFVTDATGGLITAVLEGGSGLVIRLGKGPVVAYPLSLRDDTITHAVPGTGGVLAVTGSWSGRVHRWSVGDEQTPVLLHETTDPISLIAPSPNGRFVIVSAYNATLWRVCVDGGESRELPSIGRSVVRAVFRPDGAAMFLLRGDGVGVLVDATTGEVQQETQGLTGHIVGLSFARAGGHLFTASRDGHIRIWPRVTESGECVLAGHTSSVRHATFSPDGDRVVTSSSDGTARVWQLGGLHPPHVLDSGTPRGLLFARFSHDGQHVLAATREGGAVLTWAVLEDRPPRTIQAHKGNVKDALFLPSDGRIVTGGDDAMVRVWAHDREEPPLELRGHERRVTALAVDARGERVISASWDGTVRIWSLEDPTHPLVLVGRSGPLKCLALSPDGRWLATGSEEGTARLWRLDENRAECTAVLDGHAGRIRGVSFHAFEPRLVTASTDASAGIWTFDAVTGSLESVYWLRSHLSEIQNASFSPGNGRRVLTVSSDGTARVWVPLPDGSWEGIALTGHAGPLRWGEFSPDGSKVVTASMDGTACIWDVRYDDLGARLRDTTRYRLTDEARALLLEG